METFCAQKPASDVPIKRFLPPTKVAALLAVNLGGTEDEWLAFLREDRHPGRDEGDREIPFDEHDGEFWYCDLDVLLFILSRKPPDLINTAATITGDAPFWCDAHGDIDIMNACRLMVHLSVPKQHAGHPWLSAAQARELGKSLIELADWCDTHRYDPVRKHVFRVSDANSTITDQKE